MVATLVVKIGAHGIGADKSPAASMVKGSAYLDHVAGIAHVEDAQPQQVGSKPVQNFPEQQCAMHNENGSTPLCKGAR